MSACDWEKTKFWKLQEEMGECSSAKGDRTQHEPREKQSKQKKHKDQHAPQFHHGCQSLLRFVVAVTIVSAFHFDSPPLPLLLAVE